MLSTYACNAYDHMFPVETLLGSVGYSFGLRPGDMIKHVIDRDSVGLIVAVHSDVIAVMWSKAPRRPYA